MSDMFLADDDIQALTKRKRCDAQLRVLAQMGIEYKRRPDGTLAVLRSYVEKVFGEGVTSTPRRKTSPDFSQVA